jgi:hypothetical protein
MLLLAPPHQSLLLSQSLRDWFPLVQGQWELYVFSFAVLNLIHQQTRVGPGQTVFSCYLLEELQGDTKNNSLGW